MDTQMGSRTVAVVVMVCLQTGIPAAAGAMVEEGVLAGLGVTKCPSLEPI